MRRMVFALGVFWVTHAQGSVPSTSASHDPTAPLTEKEWVEIIATDPFFEGYRHPLTDSEKDMIGRALEFHNSASHSKINRPVSQFPGDALVLGTGWALTRSSIVGRTDKGAQLSQFHLTQKEVYEATSDGSPLLDQAVRAFEKTYLDVVDHPAHLPEARLKVVNLARALDVTLANTLLETLRQGPPRFHGGTGVPLTEDEKKVHPMLVALFSSTLEERMRSGKTKPHDEELEALRKKWYTVDYAPAAKPDLQGSVTSEADMASLPDHRFSLVYYENMDYNVFLDPTLFRIARRITKPGGTIRFTVAPNGTRLVAYMLHISKWRGDPQIKEVLEATGMWDRPLVELHP